jgi:hypothetical protein
VLELPRRYTSLKVNDETLDPFAVFFLDRAGGSGPRKATEKKLPRLFFWPAIYRTQYCSMTDLNLYGQRL